MVRPATSGPQDQPRKRARGRERGGVRTTILSLVTLAALAVLVVVTLIKSLTPPESASLATTAGAPEIRGTITLAPELAGRIDEGAVLFVIARKASGPPFAVKRIAAPRFPLVYRLGAEDVMMAGQAFDGEMQMSARVSRTGSAGPPQPGDLEGEHASSVRVGARQVDIVIARIR